MIKNFCGKIVLPNKIGTSAYPNTGILFLDTNIKYTVESLISIPTGKTLLHSKLGIAPLSINANMSEL